ncbi:hypothetical protein AOLI_G00284620 [Acnodon oligacanthus]
MFVEAPRGKRKRGEEEDSQSVGEGTSESPPTEAPAAEPESFKSRYVVGHKLGQGGFGSVFNGRRVSDGLQVAIKFVSKRKTSRYLYSPFESKAVPAEVVLMQIMSQPPICKNVVQLIEWFDEPQRYILILERPDPCMDLESTLRYCPPEFLVQGSYDADLATVWSLGVLLFRMVYGHLPFASKFETMVGIFVFKDGLSKGQHKAVKESS